MNTSMNRLPDLVNLYWSTMGDALGIWWPVMVCVALIAVMGMLFNFARSI